MNTPRRSPSKLHPDGLPCLSRAQADQALEHLQVEGHEPSIEMLTQLFRAWLVASPFHNLDLLAGLAGLRPPLGATEAVTQALSWGGGPCHVQAAGFTTLLRTLGYGAQLMPATITEDGDHLIVGVTLPRGRVLCDVGNGHPYPEPFPFDRPASFTRFGWSFDTTPSADALTLHRTLPDGARKRVYTAQWERQSYGDFASVIEAHHTRAGFGPFMTNLRVVRITPHGMLSLRDARYERHTVFGTSSRPVISVDGCARLLRGPFGLAHAPIAPALDALLRARPCLFEEAAAGESLPWILLSLTTTDRPQCLRRLLKSLIAVLGLDDQGHGERTKVRARLLLVENSLRAEHRASNREIVEEGRALGLTITWVDDGRYGRSIAQSRIRQTEEVARVAAQEQRPTCVWMIDDDCAFTALERQGEHLVETPVYEHLSEVLRLRTEHPEVSVMIGPFTGDPPIRPEAVLRTQTFDLVENLRWFGDLSPDARYCAPDTEALFAMPDYYYDHSRAGTDHLEHPCPWVPRGPAGTVRQELLAYLSACLGIADGHVATRTLQAPVRAASIRTTDTPLRGGNAIFLDLDACLSHLYPAVALGDDHSRRSDMIGCTLLARSETTLVAYAPIALQHVRSSESSATLSPEARWRSLRTEFLGVLLARLTTDGCPKELAPEKHLYALASDRAHTLCDALDHTVKNLQRLDAVSTSAHVWWACDAAVLDAIATAREALFRVWASTVGGAEETPHTQRLSALHQRLLNADDLASVLAAWRSLPESQTDHHARMAAIYEDAKR